MARSVHDGVDVAVIGAGVVGCATAAALTRRGLAVVILERESKEATGVTSRNSGVIHSGLYYPPGSRKARTCVRGNAMVYGWARRHGIPHRQTGKLVVARDDRELHALHGLRRNAEASGAEGLHMLGTAQVREREPALPPFAGALLCERSGIIDPHALTRSYLHAALADGATMVPRTRVTGVDLGVDQFELQTSRGPLSATTVVNAAGLHADEIAVEFGVQEYRHHPCRGDYFRLQTSAHYDHLVYPVRPEGYVGLGVHLTIDLSGAYLLGPDAEFVDSKTDFGPAAHKLGEFQRAAEHLLGPLQPGQLQYEGCGLRPTLRPPDGAGNHDFVIHEQPDRAFHLLGIESPGLTAAGALAEEIAAMISGDPVVMT